MKNDKIKTSLISQLVCNTVLYMYSNEPVQIQRILIGFKSVLENYVPRFDMTNIHATILADIHPCTAFIKSFISNAFIIKGEGGLMQPSRNQ